MPADGCLRDSQATIGKKLQKGGFYPTETADLSNVNCHLTPPSPPGSSRRSRVKRELNQGFSCYKSPSATGRSRPTKTIGHKMGPALCLRSTEAREQLLKLSERKRKEGTESPEGERENVSSTRLFLIRKK